MYTDYQNPFADYGTIISGDRFIGRQNSLKVIESRVIRPRKPGNLAIIGEPRIGKSSLVYKAVIERRDELIAKKYLPIWINLATFDNSSLFFRYLVISCYDELEELGWLNKPIIRASERALEDELSWSEGYGRIQRFFQKVRQSDIQILFILDEFDHARFLFKGDISGFQGLRELSYRPEWRVTFITTSRRTIRHIESQTQAISTLDGIFHKHYLGMFEKIGTDAYFLRLSSVSISIDSFIQKQVDFYCGGYPYLLEMLGYEMVEMFYEQQQVDVKKCIQTLERSFLDQYDRMLDLMREDETLHKLLQILFGWAVDVKQTDIDDFLRYGLLQITEQGTYQAFSMHFQTYLKLVERQVDLRNVLRETEIALRYFITEKMRDKYGDSWIEELEKKHPKAKTLFDRCRGEQQREKNSFGSRASQNLLDFTYPRELFDVILIKNEWQTVFKSIFGKGPPYWDQRAQLLSRIRNPLAHNRDQVLYEHERQIAEGYCKEILELIRN